MEFKLTVEYPTTSGKTDKMCQWEDLEGMQTELSQLARILDAGPAGTVYTIERLS